MTYFEMQVKAGALAKEKRKAHLAGDTARKQAITKDLEVVKAQLQKMAPEPIDSRALAQAVTPSERQTPWLGFVAVGAICLALGIADDRIIDAWQWTLETSGFRSWASALMPR